MRLRKSAFTLIELLVVISIIALLIAILLPALSAARSSARSIQCLSTVRQVGIAYHQYANDFDGSLPLVKWTDASWNGNYHWFQAISVYLGEYASPTSFSGDAAKILRSCPEWRQFNYDQTYGNSRIGYGMPLKMGIGQRVIVPDWKYPNMVNVPNAVGYTRLEQWTKPTSTVATGDSDNWMIDVYWNGSTYVFGTNTGQGDAIPGYPAYKSDPARHNLRSSSNYVFLDGHAESMQPEAARKALIGRKGQ